MEEASGNWTWAALKHGEEITDYVTNTLMAFHRNHREYRSYVESSSAGKIRIPFWCPDDHVILPLSPFSRSGPAVVRFKP